MPTQQRLYDYLVGRARAISLLRGRLALLRHAGYYRQVCILLISHMSAALAPRTLPPPVRYKRR